MDDVREINKELDRLDSKLKRIEEERKEIYAKRDQKEVSKKTVGLDLLRNEKSKKKTEKEWSNAIRSLAKTTKEGKNLARQCEEKEGKEAILSQKRKDLNLAWNTATGDEEKRIGEEREAVISQIEKLEQEKKAMLEELTEMGKALREQYKAETLVIEEEELPDSGNNEQPEEEPIEQQEEKKVVVDENFVEEENVELELPKEFFEDNVESVGESMEEEEETQFDEKIQKGIDRIAEIRNLVDEYKEAFEEVCKKMPEGALGEKLITDFNKLEEVVAKNFGLIEPGKELEDDKKQTENPKQDKIDVIMKDIDHIKVALAKTEKVMSREKMIEDFQHLRNTVAKEFGLINQETGEIQKPVTKLEQNGREVIDIVEDIMNYVDSDFVSKTDVEDWILQDLRMIAESLPEKFGVMKEEQEEASEEQQPEVGAPMPTKETVVTEWMPGVQQPGNLEEEKKGEDMNQNPKPENALVSTGAANSTDEKSAEERKEQMIQLKKQVDDFTNSANRRKNEIAELKVKGDSFPEGSDERKKIEKIIEVRKSEMRVLKTQAERAKQKYDGWVGQKSVKKEEPEKKTSSEEPTIHIKAMEGTEKERVLLDLLKKSGLMTEYKAQFKPETSIPAMPLDEIGSLMKARKDRLKGQKNKTKRRTPDRAQARTDIKIFNMYKKQIKKLVKAIEIERDFVDDYEEER